MSPKSFYAFLPIAEMEFPLSRRKVAAIKNGQIRTKPKFITEHATGKVFGLIVPRDRKPYYVELPSEPEILYRLQLTPEARRRYATKPPKPPEDRFSLHTFAYNAPASELPPITLGQLHAVTNAIARPYSWVVTEGASTERKEPHFVNLLFDRDKVIGGGAWRMYRKSAYLAFLMIDPQYRGQGLGKYVCDFTTHQALAMGAHNVPIETSTNCTNARDTPVLDQYKSWGWKITKRVKVDYDMVKAGTAKIMSVETPAYYFIDQKTGDDLPRFQKAFLDRQLGKASAALLKFVEADNVKRPKARPSAATRFASIAAD